jgi:hypothetical protein
MTGLDGIADHMSSAYVILTDTHQILVHFEEGETSEICGGKMGRLWIALTDRSMWQPWFMLIYVFITKIYDRLNV